MLLLICLTFNEQVKERKVVEIIRPTNRVAATHYQVARMNFIPRGYKAPPVIQTQRAKAESQVDTEGATEDNTQVPSPNDDCACKDIILEDTRAPSVASHQELPPTNDVEMPLASPTWESDYRSSHTE